MVFRSVPRLFVRPRGLASSVVGLGLLSAIVLGNVASGCLAGGIVGSECVMNSDCAKCPPNEDCSEALICASQQCRTACTTSADCEDKDYPICVRGDGVQPYCDVRRACSVEETDDKEPCPKGQVCGRDAYCAATCESQADCVADQRCQSGVCVPLAGAPAEAGSASVGETCFTNSDCSTWLCNDGFCRGCVAGFDAAESGAADSDIANIDCPDGRVCNPGGAKGGRCEPSHCVGCSSEVGLLLLGQMPEELCPESKEYFQELLDCACAGKGSSPECVADLCADPPDPYKDCVSYIQGTCAAQVTACASH